MRDLTALERQDIETILEVTPNHHSDQELSELVIKHIYETIQKVHDDETTTHHNSHELNGAGQPINTWWTDKNDKVIAHWGVDGIWVIIDGKKIESLV